MSNSRIESKTQDYSFKNLFREQNIKPLALIAGCWYMMNHGKEELMPLYIFGLVSAVVITAMNIKHEFGLFKNSRPEQNNDNENSLVNTLATVKN